jgi:hypothetical protein
MADFIETNTNKTAVRDLSDPIADAATFDSIVQSVLDTNPFGCTDYEVDGLTVPGVLRNREHYTAKVIYEDDEAKKIGAASVQVPDIAGFDAAALEIMGNVALSTATGGDPVRDDAHDTFYCQLKCHDATGEIYYVTFTRKNVRISSYQDDVIRSTVETWADTVADLA